MGVSSESIDKFKQRLLKIKDQEESKTMKYEEKQRKTPVKTGFRLIGIQSSVRSSPQLNNEESVNVINNDPNVDGYFPVKMDFMKKKVKKGKVKTKRSSNIRNTDSYYKKKYEKVVNSTSWKVTKPIRLLGKIKSNE